MIFKRSLIPSLCRRRIYPCDQQFYRIILSFLLFFSIPSLVFAQRLNFVHYTLDNGLIQSQVTAIAQDRSNHLWLSTFGGGSRFDGRTFNTITTDDGLEDLMLSSVKIDSKDRKWFGSISGLVCLDGKKVITYPFEIEGVDVASKITFAKGKVWTLSNGKLFTIQKGKLKQVIINSKPDDFISHIEIDTQGELYAAIYGRGIYKLVQQQWIIHLQVKELIYMTRFGFDAKDKQKIHFISRNRIYNAAKGKYIQIDKEITQKLKFNFTSIISEADGGYWLGTSEGAAHLVNHQLKIFNKSNGYTNKHTNDVFKDAEKNIWFITNGDGLFRLNPHGLQLIDELLGLPNSTTGIAKDKKNTLWFGTINDGLFKYTQNKITPVPIPSNNSDSKKINNLLIDSKNNLWINTYFGGLWRLKNNRFDQIYPANPKDFALTFNMAVEDENHVVWFATNSGCFTYQNDKLTKIPNFEESCNFLYVLWDHKILAGTTSGIKLLDSGKVDSSFNIPTFRKSNVLCVEKLGDILYLGTDNTGLIILNLKNKKYKIISVKDGLYSNSIYSLGIVNQQLWVGTGLGINHLEITKNPMNLVLQAESESFVAEGNQNAMYIANGLVYFGTSKSVAIYDPYQAAKNNLKPYIVIQNVTVNNTIKVKDTVVDGYNLPIDLELPPDQNNLTIKFQGVSLKDPIHVKYAYHLQGLNTNFSKYDSNNTVSYSDLPPGKYIFKVKAIFQGKYVSNMASFSFEVLPAFYQTRIFQVLMIILIICLIYAFTLIRLNQQKRKIAEVHLMRLAEQEKIRKQTAEDLHDDFGNKLTRINMISELLDKLISKENKDIKLLIKQIRFSATEMYSGTKDLLWALNPQNDALSAVILQIKKIIEDTIKHTKINFIDNSIDTDYVDVNLPLGYSRNITLITKELATNMVRHSKAKEVTFNLEMDIDGNYVFTFIDDGIGFNMNNIEEGHGLKNMQNRAAKLNGSIHFLSTTDYGTKIVLTIALP